MKTIIQNITNKIDAIRYEYDPNEFMPIFRDNKLDNRTDYINYKLKPIHDYMLALGNTLNHFVATGEWTTQGDEQHG